MCMCVWFVKGVVCGVCECVCGCSWVNLGSSNWRKNRDGVTHNRVIKKIFATKRETVTGWLKLCSVELQETKPFQAILVAGLANMRPSLPEHHQRHSLTNKIHSVYSTQYATFISAQNVYKVQLVSFKEAHRKPIIILRFTEFNNRTFSLTYSLCITV